MKLIQLKDMDGHDTYINPERIAYVHDLSSFSQTKSAVGLETETIYVPMNASAVYETIREETDPNYISYDRMMELIAAERKYKEMLARGELYGNE